MGRDELVTKLLAWRHPCFSAHVGEPISPEEKQKLEDTAAKSNLLSVAFAPSTVTRYSASAVPGRMASATAAAPKDCRHLLRILEASAEPIVV